MDQNDAYRSPQSDVSDSYEGGVANVKPFTTQGRIGRAYYVIYSMGITTLIQIALVIFVFAIATTGSELLAGIGGVAAALVYLGMLVFQFIWTIRRAHDASMSGWMSVLILIPLVFLVFWFIPGTRGPNKYGPAPKRGPLGLAIAIGAILPAIFVLGILAAIAIPAYQDYTQRAQVGECMVASAGVRQAVAQSLQDTGRFPDAQTISTTVPELPIESTYCVIDIDTASEQVVMTFRGDSPTGQVLQRGSIYYTFEVVENTLEGYCSSDTITDRFLPRSCQRVD